MRAAQASYERFRGIRNFGALDGLRAISVIAVVWQHTSGRPGPEILSKGYFGVDLFFAISGFLITTLLLRERDEYKQFSLPKFYIRRIFRIFPIYYVVLGLYVALVLVSQQETATGKQFLHHLPSFLTYTSNWFVGKANGDSVTFYFAWSLATEEQFYAFWPPLLALLLVLPGRGVVKALGALGALVIISQLALTSAPSSLPLVIVSSLALPILLGAALAITLHHQTGFSLVALLLAPRLSGPIVALLILLSLVRSTPEQLTQLLMVLLIGCLCIRERTALHPVLSWRPLAYVGKISYGIYLMHMLCANVARRAIGERFGVALFCLTVVTVILAASISYRWLEKPLLRLGHRWSGRPAVVPPAATSAATA